MAETQARNENAAPSGLPREETALAYAAIFVLLGAIAFTIGAIFV